MVSCWCRRRWGPPIACPRSVLRAHRNREYHQLALRAPVSAANLTRELNAAEPRQQRPLCAPTPSARRAVYSTRAALSQRHAPTLHARITVVNSGSARLPSLASHHILAVSSSTRTSTTRTPRALQPGRPRKRFYKQDAHVRRSPESLHSHSTTPRATQFANPVFFRVPTRSSTSAGNGSACAGCSQHNLSTARSPNNVNAGHTTCDVRLRLYDSVDHGLRRGCGVALET
ncbi:hypothetical protein B0H10DRAFT_2005560 [Mycena sp. CBHHK59/15]|nr:hypothetical protein B0H10DRAFT_2005560 [Mycena sp. CBHHK59/15]